MSVPAIQSFEDFEAAALAAIAPPPYQSRFGAIQAHELFTAAGAGHEWLIKNLLVRGELAMLVGASQSGKSFFAIELALAIARGVPVFGRRVIQGLVLYQAGESATGVRRKRLPAYWKAKGIPFGDRLPFVLLPRPLDLYSSDEAANAFIAESRHWTEHYETRLELIVIDTFSAATPGANENASQDVTKVLARCGRLSTETGAAVLFVHHLNADGTKARGHTSIFANLESVIVCSRVEVKKKDEVIVIRDNNGRPIRRVTLSKLKDGEDGGKIDFVLRAVEIGRDEDGEPITSCIVEPPDGGDGALDTRPKAGKGPRVTDDVTIALQALDRAIDEHGEPLPESIGIKSIGVHFERWIGAYTKSSLDEAMRLQGVGAVDQETLLKILRKAWAKLMAEQVIMFDRPWVWRTGKRISGERVKSVQADVEPQSPPVTPSLPLSPPQPEYDDIIDF